MKKFSKILLFSIIAIIFTSCMNTNREDLTDLIKMPKQDKPIIEGSWEVVEIKGNKLGEKATNIKIGDKLYINKNLVALDDSYAFPPSFNSKYVKLSEYLKNRGIDPSENIEDRNVIVVNASQGQLFSRDFILTSERYLFIIKDDNIVSFKKVSDKVDSKVQDSYAKLAARERTTTGEGEDVAEDLSLLLGVRERIDPESDKALYKYYTYLIRIKPDDTINYQKAEDIFFKNQDEYWKVRLDINSITDFYDEIEAYPVKIKESNDEKSLLQTYTFKNIDLNMRLNFVSKDFISMDYTETGNINPIRKYAIMETNYISENKFISLEEFTGEDQSDLIFKEKVKDEVDNNFSIKDISEVEFDNTNFGIVRGQGMWTFQSSISKGDGDEFVQNFFNLDIAIGNSMLNQSNSLITRDSVYNINTQAKDYLVLANQRYILIQTSDEILIHKINDGIIEKRPTYAIATRMPATIISTDQFLGSNADDVEEAFKKYNSVIEK
ncbi:hypothetical protein [uncultured Anaerococcus sp.]|uniref:hypothetical protein n=1 Tax=uncultured Anaerococcus sp. TaxID=293428 RepID=UPI0025F0FB51|nr:hypothetical protein [uncultured Anaerococcus sp.]